MSTKKYVLANRKGFTLVELLIVVAIIGVLASQGVPAYRRMIQKSRQGEAKVMLGNIKTGESAFFSEYGVYGNNLPGMGIQMAGSTASTFTYVAGFPDGTCTNPITSSGGIVPTTAKIPNLVTSYTVAVNGSGLIGNTDLKKCQAATVPADGGTTFTATATGNVQAPGLDCVGLTSAGGTPAQNACDAWTLDNTGVVALASDGIAS
jgi:type IV pilus assembly protein PilE